MKISIEIFEKIINFCTAKEMDVILFLASMQNQYGEVLGVTYQQVCEEVGISKSYFYKSLYRLEEYGILQIDYANEDYGTWQVRLCNNEFSCHADYKKGYFKINRKVLSCDCFRTLNRTEKIILLKLLFMQDKKGHQFKVFADTIQDWTGRSLRTVRSAIDRLCALGLICVIRAFGNGYSFAAKEKELGGGKAVENESIPRMRQLISLVLRRKRVQASETAVNDVTSVLKGFADCLDKYILQKLERCIEDCGGLTGAYVNRVMHG